MPPREILGADKAVTGPTKSNVMPKQTYEQQIHEIVSWQAELWEKIAEVHDDADADSTTTIAESFQYLIRDIEKQMYDRNHLIIGKLEERALTELAKGIDDDIATQRLQDFLGIKNAIAKNAANKVRLIIDNEVIEFPYVKDTEGDRIVGARGSYQNHRILWHNPGFSDISSTESRISQVDGKNGRIRIRGFDIADLAENTSLTEAWQVLLNGELPTEAANNEFNEKLGENTKLEKDLVDFLNTKLMKNAHPMAALSSAIGMLSAVYPEDVKMQPGNQYSKANIKKAVFRSLGQIPIINANLCKLRRGEKSENIIEADPALDPATNFLRILNSSKDNVIDPSKKDLTWFKKYLILMSDHEQNAGTTAMREGKQVRTNMYASLNNANNVLWGPLHGGATQAVIEMFEDIAKFEGDNIKEKVVGYLLNCMDTGSRVMGFGHRVYKTFDPRATILKDEVANLLDSGDAVAGNEKQDKAAAIELGAAMDELMEGEDISNNQLLQIAMKLEEIILNPNKKIEYNDIQRHFAKNNLYPNVDFYAGIGLLKIGFQKNELATGFTIGRLAGWIAHWIESEDPIARPRQKSKLVPDRHVSEAKRKDQAVDFFYKKHDTSI
jgi:citrate synthase